MLTPLMDSPRPWRKPLGDWIHGIDHAVFHAVPMLRDLLNGRWLGHPLHPAITDIPIGVLGLVILFDVIGQPVAAWWSLLVGVLAMLGAALAGYADYADTDGRARERATLHSMLMLAALALYLVSLVLRAGSISAAPSVVAVALSVIAWLIVVTSAYVGGDVVYVDGNMVSRHAFRGSGTKWIALEPAEVDALGAIPEGRPVKAKLGINTLVLVREADRILALHDTCAHAGGPLSGGAYQNGIVECPWHASRYRM